MTTHTPPRALLDSAISSPAESPAAILKRETAHDKAQVTRLAHKARALGLAVWPQRARKAVA